MSLDFERMCSYCSWDVHPDDTLHPVQPGPFSGHDTNPNDPPWQLCDFCYGSHAASAWMDAPTTQSHQEYNDGKDRSYIANILRADLRRFTEHLYSPPFASA